MLKKYVDILALEAKYLTITSTHIIVVNVTIHSPEDGFHGFKAVCNLHGTNVTSVPYLVTFAKIILVFIVPIAVSI